MFGKSLQFWSCTKFRKPYSSISAPQTSYNTLHIPNVANGFQSFNSLFDPLTTTTTIISDDSETLTGSASLSLSTESESGLHCFSSSAPKIHRGSVYLQTEKILGRCSSSDSEYDIAAAVASRRFFLSPPGPTSSIIGTSTSSNSDSESVDISERCRVVAVATYSSDPYADFRRSMEETAAALEIAGEGRFSRAKLDEMLLCYLVLNGEHVREFIVNAFVDLLNRKMYY